MKMVKIAVTFDDGSNAEYTNAQGVAFSDIPKMLGMTSDDIVNAEPGTPQALIYGVIQAALGLAMKKFGI